METWQYSPEPGASFRAALKGGKTAVMTAPPSYWADVWLFRLLLAEYDLPGLQLVITRTTTDALRVSDQITSLGGGPSHAATGVRYTGTVVARGFLKFLAVSPLELHALLKNSAIPVESVSRIIVMDPRGDEELARLDDLLSQISAPRIFRLSTTDGLGDFLQRHAHRAPVFSTETSATGVAVSSKCRFTVATWSGIAAAVRNALDVVSPDTALVWTPGMPREWAATYAADPGVVVTDDLSVEGQFPLAVAVDLPDGPALGALSEKAAELIFVVGAHQVDALRQMIGNLTAIRLSSEADRARERTLATRQLIRDLIESGESHLDEELIALAPLLDEHDPALVAAALARAVKAPPMAEAPDTAFARLFVSIGKTDGVRPGDIVGALLNGVGIAKSDLGKIDIAERHTVVEVAANAAERAIRGLNGSTIKKRRITARYDRK